MAKKLKLILVLHYEDSMVYTAEEASMMALFSTMVTMREGRHGTARGAQVSWQFDVTWFTPAPPLEADGYPINDGNPTSMHLLLDCGHNWWVQNHSATYPHLKISMDRITSAYAMEKATASPITPVGRSGGSDPDDPVDWVSIGVWAGIKASNCAVQQNFDYTPEDNRPMCYSIDEIKKLRRHQRGPGTTNPDCPSTMVHRMQQSPFWMDSASRWDRLASELTPGTDQGSMAYIPHPLNDGLDRVLQDHTAFEDKSLDVFNCNAALTHIHSTYEIMDTQLQSLVNCWYVIIPPNYIKSSVSNHTLLCNWVDSINEIMDVHAEDEEDRKAEWLNMDHITSLVYAGSIT